MSDNWIIKPLDAKKLEITVPDGYTVEDVPEIALVQLQKAIADWLETQALVAKPMGWCIAGCGIQA